MSAATVPAPVGLLAELTHRCPLHCPYCSNPLELVGRERELDTDAWADVFAQARALGVLQVHLSGGEPLARPDLDDLVAAARRHGCYTNLVTSGLGLTPERAAGLAAAGLDHVQLSVQDADPVSADRIAGTRAHRHKRSAAAAVVDLGLPLTVNVVLHRGNLDHVGELIDLAEELGAERVELANTQYYGWGLRNRAALAPTVEQLARADPIVAAAADRDMTIVYVRADHHDPYPKPCMNGWASRQLTVAPDGRVLPCPTADVITDLPVESVTESSLEHIWYASRSFNAFRGTDWMQDPCRSCARREIDFGGCRCQAAQLLGDAAATDPVCSLSPHRGVVDAAIAEAAVAEPPVAVPRR